jgi:hypothetical protein
MIINLSKLIILFVLITSCTTVHFKSGGQLELYVGGKVDHVKKVVAKGKSEFYLFGIIPSKSHTIYIDEVLFKAGMKSAANISIFEYQTAEDMWISFFSMGFYIPTRYKIWAYGRLDADDDRVAR